MIPARRTSPLDRALTETFTDRINAARDVLRATRELAAARAENIPSRIDSARKRLMAASDRDFAAKKNLEAAVAAEALERA